ncbi:MAG: glycoside hydrolase family 3 N-terminal domain-containing protein [Rikenellaceae bacterium]
MKRALILLLSLATVSCGDKFIYKDSTQPIERRVEDLIARMSVEEKAAQLDMLSAKEIVLDESRLSDNQMAHYIDSMTIGTIHDLYPNNATIANTIQRRAMERTRLGIPLLFIEEGLHGYQGIGSTTFPAQIGNSSSWDTLLMRKIGRVIGTEARIHGVHFILGPNLDLAREIRWGRVEETFGEDPYLASRMGVNIIKGMQGDSLNSPYSVAAEPKHFGVHGIPEGGTNSSPVNIGEREARSTHLYAFERAVKEAGARGIMAAYHEIDGIPCSSNRWLLSDLLRDEWGFRGVVVADLGTIRLQVLRHQTAATPKEAVLNSLNAGLNVQFYDFPYDTFQSSIVEAVRDGILSEKILDERVADVLRLKFELGLFENPYIDDKNIEELHHCDTHRELALEASHKSIVLLKNEDNTLPFKGKIRRITLIGEQGNLSLLGGYSPAQARGITLYEGLKQRFGKGVEIDYIENQVEDKFKSIPNSALFTTASGEENGVIAEYFNNPKIEGAAAYRTIDSEVSHYWHNLSPVPGVNRDNFSARWSGYIRVPVSGEYEFELHADDCARLYINDKIVGDVWDKPKSTTLHRCYLRAGDMLPIRSEYAEVDHLAKMSLRWRLTKAVSEEELYNRVARSVAKSDITILALGEIIDAVGEGKDRQNLNMAERDVRLLEIVKQSGKPSATVFMNGRPFVMTPADDLSPAVVEAWFPGEWGGKAICDILFGDVCPSGKLSISIPRSEGQMPAYYSKRRSFKSTYVDGTAAALYPFGHGLSYTKFEYSDLRLSKSEITQGDSIEVSFIVKNVGECSGTEVAQLYIGDKVSSVSLPAMSLKGFARVDLEAGEQREVVISITPEQLSLINIDMQREVESGDFEIQVGPSSRVLPLKATLTVR